MNDAVADTDTTNSDMGVLYIVATPIGNLSDISQRAIETLRDVDVILAEDTRHTKPLLQQFSINTRLFAYHDHNEQQQVPKILERLLRGENLALVSDAGTPLISDPGYSLVQAAQNAGISVCPIPGACALITALSASGMPTDQFHFGGFLPHKQQNRLRTLKSIANSTHTTVFYESSHRIVSSLEDCVAVFGSRPAAIARELTKKFETIKAADLPELLDFVCSDDNQQRGEFVVIIGGAQAVDDSEQQLEHTLTVLLANLPLSQAVELSAKLLGLKKNKVYQFALAMQKA